MLIYLQNHLSTIIVLSIPAAFLTLLFIAAMFEKRLTRPYVRLDHVDAAAGFAPGHQIQYDSGLPDVSVISEYVQIMSRDIQECSFRFGGVVAHAKTKQNKILATVWMSPDQRILTITGAGTVLGMPSRQTWCYTPLNDGTFLVTTDQNDEGGSVADFSLSQEIKRAFSRPFANCTRSD